MKKKRLILLGYRNKEIGLYKSKISRSKKLIGLGLCAFSFIVPDLSLGLMFGLVLLSPLSFKKSFKNKLSDLKDYARFKWMRRGL